MEMNWGVIRTDKIKIKNIVSSRRYTVWAFFLLLKKLLYFIRTSTFYLLWFVDFSQK